MAQLDELFTGASVKKPLSRPTRKTLDKRVEMDAARRKPPRAEQREDDEAYAHKTDANCGGVLESVENACNGNRYLEAMILGDILNSPKFKNSIKK